MAVSAAMLLGLPLPDFGPGARCTPIAWHADEGERIPVGGALLDLRIDLGGGLAQDCPPVSTCRVVLREAAWLRRRIAPPDDVVPPQGLLALLSIDADEPLDAVPLRDVRCTVAAILHHADWWGGAP